VKFDFVCTVDDSIYFFRNLRAVRRGLKRFHREIKLRVGYPRSSKTTAVGAFLVIAGIVVSFASAAYLTVIASLIWLTGLVPTGLFLAFMLRFALFPVSAKSIRAKYQKDPSNGLPITAFIDDAGFHYITATSQRDVDWAGIVAVVLLGEAVAVVDLEQTTYYIPRRLFIDDEQSRTFVRLVESHIAQTTGTIEHPVSTS
jgi:hypothetical protein